MVTLVTGATGFIGSAVVKGLLQRGERVRALVREGSDPSNLKAVETFGPVEKFVGDLTDPLSLHAALEGVQSLYHVAADYRLWAPLEQDIHDANVGGTSNVLTAAIERSVGRIVYTSSVCTLATSRGDVPSTEEQDASPSELMGAYKISKFRAEQVARRLAKRGAPIVIVNPSTPIGPRDIKPTPTGRTIRDAGLGKIPAYVDTGLNFVHVDDVANGHLLAHDRGVVGERYILGGHNVSLKSILNMIGEMTGQRLPKIPLPRHAVYPIAVISEFLARTNGEDPLVTLNGLRLAKKKMYFSSEKAVRELGYSYRPLREALNDALAGFGIETVATDAATFDGTAVAHLPHVADA